MKKIILLFICCFCLSGCFDYKELNDMSIVNGIGIDYKDGEYVVYLEINNSVKKNGDSELVTEIIEGSNKNIALAYNEAIQSSSKVLYAEHVNLLLLSKEIANKGIGEIIDFLLRDLTINNNYMVVIADKPKDILNIKKNNNSIVNVIVDTIKYDINSTYKYDLDFVAAKLLNMNINLVLPYVEINNDNVIVRKIACFKEDKFKNMDEAKVYNFLIHDIDSVDFRQANNVINVYNKKIKYEVEKNKIVIKITGNGNIKETDKKYNLKKINDYEEIEKIINKEIKKEITEYIDNAFNKGIDLFSLKDKYYKKYKTYKDNLKYEVNVDVTLNKNGSIYEVIYD